MVSVQGKRYSITPQEVSQMSLQSFSALWTVSGDHGCILTLLLPDFITQQYHRAEGSLLCICMRALTRYNCSKLPRCPSIPYSVQILLLHLPIHNGCLRSVTAVLSKQGHAQIHSLHSPCQACTASNTFLPGIAYPVSVQHHCSVSLLKSSGAFYEWVSVKQLACESGVHL